MGPNARGSSSDGGEEYWRAVLERSRDHDGRFFFAVRTTGIYCRPSCPARRPRRENVEFFDDPQRAREAGYRACRRCAPDSSDLGTSQWVLTLCRRHPLVVNVKPRRPNDGVTTRSSRRMGCRFRGNRAGFQPTGWRVGGWPCGDACRVLSVRCSNCALRARATVN
jgi:methylphosphotriester-DNA--protein-cysteine methyltransferase